MKTYIVRVKDDKLNTYVIHYYKHHNLSFKEQAMHEPEDELTTFVVKARNIDEAIYEFKSKCVMKVDVYPRIEMIDKNGNRLINFSKEMFTNVTPDRAIEILKAKGE